MKWIGERISIVESPKKTSIIIYPENKFWEKGLMSAWFSMWLVIGATMMWSLKLKLTEQEKIIVVVFLVFWAFYAVKVGRSLFWLLWGKEMIRITPDGFTYKKSIKGYGKSNNYFLENIKTFTMNFPKDNSFQAVWENSPWVQNVERIHFEYISKNIKFGRKLIEKDTELLFKLVTKRIEEYLKVKK